jgi:hypothetical protein
VTTQHYILLTLYILAHLLHRDGFIAIARIKTYTSDPAILLFRGPGPQLEDTAKFAVTCNATSSPLVVEGKVYETPTKRQKKNQTMGNKYSSEDRTWPR